MDHTVDESAYSVRDYSNDQLIDLLSQHPGTSREIVCNRSHAGYLAEYFGPSGTNAKTILVENEYIDRDFLEDYSSYYVRCFRDYASTCKRLHFFAVKITEAMFDAWLRGEASAQFQKQLQKSYIGFIVVKPLPKTIIGRTCLKTYPDDNNRLYFPALRTYKVNLFGMPLEITDTLAFQEQDSVASACATSALWSTFQATGKLFQHRIPSPVEITKAALVRFPMDERDLPNHGLSVFRVPYMRIFAAAYRCPL